MIGSYTEDRTDPVQNRIAAGRDDTMDQQQGARYAVYFVPAAESALYRFGSAVLQYDCYTGNDVLPPAAFAGDAEAWREATAEPRRYGFHATLKAPFHLSPSCTEAQLVSAVQSFAALGRRAPAFRPAVRLLIGRHEEDA